MMTCGLKRSGLFLLCVASALLSGCVSQGQQYTSLQGQYTNLQGQYTNLQGQYQQLQQSSATQAAQNAAAIAAAIAALKQEPAANRAHIGRRQHQQLQQSSATQATQNAAAIAALKQEPAANRAHIGRLQDAIKYTINTINSDLLFPSGSWQMSPEGQEIIAKLAPKLAPFQQTKIVVNGYTDNAPVSLALQRQGIPSNEVLSQKRAEAVMQYLISQGVRPDMIAARGFGEADPIASNATEQGRAQNRRVEVTLAGQPSP